WSAPQPRLFSFSGRQWNLHADNGALTRTTFDAPRATQHPCPLTHTEEPKVLRARERVLRLETRPPIANHDRYGVPPNTIDLEHNRDLGSVGMLPCVGHGFLDDAKECRLPPSWQTQTPYF